MPGCVKFDPVLGVEGIVVFHLKSHTDCTQITFRTFAPKRTRNDTCSSVESLIWYSASMCSRRGDSILQAWNPCTLATHVYIM